MLVSAESCTSGWLVKQITDLSGSSAIFDRGFVTYNNDSKQDMLGVQKNTMDGYIITKSTIFSNNHVKHF